MNGTALLTGVEKIADLFRKFLAMKVDKRRERFEKLFRPLFEDFLKIHSDYVSMFGQLIHDLFEISSGDPAKKEDYLTHLRSNFGKQRRMYHATRVEIRHLSDQLIRSAQSEEEAIFLWTLICYFLQNIEAHQTAEILTFKVDTLRRDGYHVVLDTPSSVIFEFLMHEDDPKKIMEFAMAQINTICGHLSDTCKAHARLKDVTYS